MSVIVPHGHKDEQEGERSTEERQPWWAAFVMFLVAHGDAAERIVCIFTMSVLLLHLMGLIPAAKPQSAIPAPTLSMMMRGTDP